VGEPINMTDDGAEAPRMRDPNKAASVGLPPRTFLYTLDQLSTLTGTSVKVLRESHLYFYGRDGGVKPPARMMARNIASEEDAPDWRVAEGEFVRWMKLKGFRVYSRGWAID
jgi:hypothetical protein